MRIRIYALGGGAYPARCVFYGDDLPLDCE